MESFTDESLIKHAEEGDRLAIVVVCKQLGSLMSAELQATRFGYVVLSIANGGTPNDAFGWQESTPRQKDYRAWVDGRKAVKNEAQDILQNLTEGDIGNDKSLYFYVNQVLAELASGTSPDKSFRWERDRRGMPSVNVSFRDFDIKMTVRDLIRSGYSHNIACEIVEQTNPYNIGLSAIKGIASKIKGASDIPFPEDIFPLPDGVLTGKLGIKQERLDRLEVNYKLMKNNKKTR